jgi:hypothetical protein
VIDNGKPSPPPTVHGEDSDEIVCLHDVGLEPYEDDPMHDMCAGCGEFELKGDGTPRLPSQDDLESAAVATS